MILIVPSYKIIMPIYYTLRETLRKLPFFFVIELDGGGGGILYWVIGEQIFVTEIKLNHDIYNKCFA